MRPRCECSLHMNAVWFTLSRAQVNFLRDINIGPRSNFSRHPKLQHQQTDFLSSTDGVQDNQVHRNSPGPTRQSSKPSDLIERSLPSCAWDLHSTRSISSQACFSYVRTSDRWEYCNNVRRYGDGRATPDHFSLFSSSTLQSRVVPESQHEAIADRMDDRIQIIDIVPGIRKTSTRASNQ